MNFGLTQARGSLIAFTDDDCIVDRKWFEKISKYFEKNSDVQVLFGQVMPWGEPKGEYDYCVATFEIDRERKYKSFEGLRPNIDFGSGNNMVVRKDVFDKIGNFREWLGPGSPGYAADETELLWRLMAYGGTFGLDPKLKVWHDRWMRRREVEKMRSLYTSSLMAVAGYYLFGEQRGLARQWIVFKFKERTVEKMKTIFGRLADAAKETIFLVWETVYFAKGLVWGAIIRLWRPDKDRIR